MTPEEEKRDKEYRLKAVELTISFYQGRINNDMEKTLNQFEATYIKVYKFISNKFTIPQ